MMSDTTILSELVTALDVIVIECLEHGRCRVVGGLPEWCERVYPVVAAAAAADDDLALHELSPVLDNFLVDAEVFWQGREAGRLASGPWTEVDTNGNPYVLEAFAVRVGSRHLLGLERLGVAHEQARVVLQKAREASLDHYRLSQTEVALRTSHNDLVSILNELRIGTAMLNARGQVTFLSQVCQEVLGTRGEQALGRYWEEISPFTAEANTALIAMTERPVSERTKVPAQLEAASGQYYWMEIDVQDDPRDTRGKIICFYDMTEVHDLRRLLGAQGQFHDLVGKSEPMMQTYEQIQDVARVDATVIIEGDTGTGKELVAQAIHANSHRASQPFVAVNCAGLTESLLASQLFGHRRGAFTGAVADQQGLFEAANGGTLFLDEIGDIPLPVQTSLLRVLQEREIIRLGDARPRTIDVRIVAATHRNLQEEVDKGTFRADLLYRIRVARIHLPALRQRRQDIPLLTSAFLARCRAEMGKPVQEVSHEAMRRLLDYTWPGNVRELKSAIEFAVIRCRGAVILAEDLPPELIDAFPMPLTLDDISPQDEKQRVLSALEQVRGNRTAAARLLGMSRATFYRRLESLGIS